MSALKLEYDVRPGGEAESDCASQAFPTLDEFLQPGSATSEQEAANAILALLPDEKPLGSEVWSIGELCIELGQQIPPDHPAQDKLVHLVKRIGESPKTTHTHNSRVLRYQRLGESLRDHLIDPTDGDVDEAINFHALAAKLERVVWDGKLGPTWTIWAMRDAFEQSDSYYPSESVRDGFVACAAQYILQEDQGVFQGFGGGAKTPTEEESRLWRFGPAYPDESHPELSPNRWQLWKDGFRACADRAESSVVKDCATKAAQLMDTYEAEWKKL